jgi:predicted phage tail component-like protein
MYNFIDVTGERSEIALPSEAMRINGAYIEELIPGYRTLNVQGRESLSPELMTFKTGVRDGSVLQNRRYPERTIIVKYQIIAETNEAFRAAYNQLGGVLNVENAELIFEDEPDKFFIGTPSKIREVEPGKNSVIGEFEILCADPFKYSVLEYEAEPDLDENSILLDYNGTYKAFPTLEADFFNEEDVSEDGETETALTGSGDCGYVAFFTEDEKIIQLGNPDEVDGETAYAKSQTLVNQSFKASSAWGSAAKKQWPMNSGNVIPNSLVKAGSLGMAVASYAVPANPATTSGTLCNVWSYAGQPNFKYTVTAKTSGRTASSVKVNISITAALRYDGSYFGHGYGLTASVYIGGAWRNVKLKDTSAYWRGKTAHTVNLTVTVTGLSNTAASLSGIKFKVTRNDSTGGTAGILNETACNNLKISPYTASEPETHYLHPTSYSTAVDTWHGPTITRTLPADASGEVGATNFTLTYKQKMCIGNGKNDTKQLGGFQAQLTAADGTNVAGVRIKKSNSGNKATIYYYILGAVVYTGTIDLSYNNKYFGAKESAVQTSKITKSGNKVTFAIGGVTKSYKDDDIAALKVTKLTFMFEQWSTSAALSYNGLYWAKFVKNNCNTFRDIPNKFSAGDVLIADCKNGTVTLNGIAAPELGALGNDWEDFALTPGLNQIGIAYSEWLAADYAPKMKVRYREVYL